jgi:uncharacterized protein (DUF488 family)
MERQPPGTQMRNRLLSVGHSDHDLANFFTLLREAGVSAVADVRSSPYSRWLPHFSRGDLERSLAKEGIAYVFLGHLLGGRPDDPDLYDADQRVDYERVRGTEFFQEGLERLRQGLERYSIAALCSEEDPLDCHRGLMIAPALKATGLEMSHLRGDGRIETAAEMEARLLAETGVGAGLLDGLFAAQITAEDRAAFMAEAYRRQAKRRAFRQREDESE